LSKALTFLTIVLATAVVVGLALTQAAVQRAWATGDPSRQAEALGEARDAFGRLLVPAALATGTSGVFLAVESGYNLISTRWLVATEALYLLVLVILLPLLGFALERVHLLALEAFKKGASTVELEEALADRAPAVLGAGIAFVLIAATALAVFKP